MNIQKRGFTLVEILITITIIGILSSVVLGNLSTARDKGVNATVKASLANARSQANLYYDENRTYTGVCAQGATYAIGGIVTDLLTKLSSSDALGDVCQADDDEWVVALTLRESAGVWCVDYKGASTSTSKTIIGEALVNGNIDCD